MTAVEIVPATQAHVEALAPLLRSADVAELLALGLEPAAELASSVRISEVACAALFDGEVGSIAGVWKQDGSALGGDEGKVWMLSGRACSRHPKAFVRTSSQVLRQFRGRYDLLWNVVDARYRGALRWAKRLGFEIHPAVPMGPRGLLFHPISCRGF